MCVKIEAQYEGYNNAKPGWWLFTPKRVTMLKLLPFAFMMHHVNLPTAIKARSLTLLHHVREKEATVFCA